MKDINNHNICGAIHSKDYPVSGTADVKQRTEVFYCTQPPGHVGAHVARGEEGNLKGKILKTWIDN